MPHHFRVTIQPVDAPGGAATGEATAFDVTNHDDILRIADRIRAGQPVPAAEATEFAVGLKLFTEVVLRHRKDPLFADLQPHIGAFMKRLKAHNKAVADGAPGPDATATGG